MLQYLIIQLCDTSTSYCNYENPSRQPRLISLDDLRAGIFFAMKENLMIQFVYPDYELPQAYKEVIDTIDHNDIVHSLCSDKELLDNCDIVIFNDWTALDYYSFDKEKAYVLRTSKIDFFARHGRMKDVLAKTKRFNIVITDAETFTKGDYKQYEDVLRHLQDNIYELYSKGIMVQFNLLTDRMTLSAMNNCDAGWKNITLAPDGCFYVCPAFYFNGERPIGDVDKGLYIKNPQLYRIEYAPICKHCDAYQCKRCIWLNKKLTLEVNTPSHEQCVISHIERNSSRELLQKSKIKEMIKEPSEIKEISYLDPFDVRDQWDYELLQQELIKFHKENY